MMNVNESSKMTNDKPHNALPLGFKFSGVKCGIKASGALDLAIISTDKNSVAAGVYTQNIVRAASIDWNRAITPSSEFRALVINSGNANACTGEQGIADNQLMAAQVAELIGAAAEQVCVLSTGVIGHLLPTQKISAGIADAISKADNSKESFELASQAIMTTDKGPKTVTKSVAVGDQKVQLASMAKGAGMIGPNMATMLAVVTTDAKLSPEVAQRLLTQAADKSFNRISVEGHTSTNDALLLICTGESGVEVDQPAQIEQFAAALDDACIELAKQIPSDGEGSTHLVSIEVSGAETDQHADQVARTIAASALVKTAITGADPNWGRIVSAAGYAGVPMQVEQTDLQLNGHYVFRSGQPIDFEAATVSRSMADNFETMVQLKIGSGPGSAMHWTSDLTVDYVRFNSEYTLSLIHI